MISDYAPTLPPIRQGVFGITNRDLGGEALSCSHTLSPSPISSTASASFTPRIFGLKKLLYLMMIMIILEIENVL